MSTNITKLVTVNAPDKDVVFDGLNFGEAGAVKVTAAKSVTIKNCRFEGYVAATAEDHVITVEAACDLVVEGCRFGANVQTEELKVFNLFDLAEGITGRIANNYFAEGCDSNYLDNIYYPEDELLVEVGPNQCEFDVEEKHFGDVPFCIGSVGYDTLADAIAAVEEDGIILMRRDVPVAYGISVPSGKKFTVDMQGHTYFAEKPGAGSTGTKTQAFQLLKDSTITFKNGTVGCTEANRDARWESDSEIKGVAMIFQNYANFTLENMVIDGTNIAHNGGTTPRYLCSNNNGEVNFVNTKFITVPGDVAFDACRYSSYTKVAVTVKGCVADKFEVSVDGNDVKDGCDLTFISGTYGNLMVGEGGELATVKKHMGVEVGVPAGYGWQDQGDGTMLLVPVNP